MSVPVLQLNAGHRAALARHFGALDRDDLRLRFGTAVSADWIRDSYVGRVDFDNDAVFGVLADDLELAGVAHLGIIEETAEFGVSVLAGQRGRGIGAALFDRAAAWARNRRLKTFFMHCLAENETMMHIARNTGMDIVRSSDEADAYLRLPPGDPASYTDEMLQTRLALFDFALKSQVAAARAFNEAVRPSGASPSS